MGGIGSGIGVNTKIWNGSSNTVKSNRSLPSLKVRVSIASRVTVWLPAAIPPTTRQFVTNVLWLPISLVKHWVSPCSAPSIRIRIPIIPAAAPRKPEPEAKINKVPPPLVNVPPVLGNGPLLYGYTVVTLHIGLWILPFMSMVSKSPFTSVQRRAVPFGLYQTKRSPAAGAAGQAVNVRRKKP